MDNLTETKLTSEKIYSGCILDFYRDTVRLPNGGTAPRELTRHVGAVCIVPLLDDGRVIVERQFRYPVNEVITEIPAGKRDSRDEAPEAAARRELREELGLVHDFTKERPFLTTHFERGFDDWYFIRMEADIRDICLQPEEVQDARWADLAEIERMLDSGEMVPYYRDLVRLWFVMKDHRGSTTHE